jgi:hypothetical protein
MSAKSRFFSDAKAGLFEPGSTSGEILPESAELRALPAADLAASDWGPTARAALRREVLETTPRWYSALGHFVFPALFGIAVIVVCALYLKGLRTVELLTIPFTLVLSNAIEWNAHKKVLHKRHWLLPMLFERHTPVHHKLFTYDDMEITDWREVRNVLLPSFGVLAILSLQLPLLGLALVIGARNIALLFMATSMAYVLAYEWLHLAYHLPKDSFIGRRPLIRWLRRHHARHHDPRLMQRWNMNVTVPLWDWLKHTIYEEPPAASGER